MCAKFLRYLLWFLFVTLIVIVNANGVILQWDASVCEGDCSGIDGYKIYWGNEPGNYSYSQDVGDVLTIDLPIPLDSYVAATAYNEFGESDFSAEIFYSGIPPPIEIKPASGGSISTEYVEGNAMAISHISANDAYDQSSSGGGSFSVTVPASADIAIVAATGGDLENPPLISKLNWDNGAGSDFTLIASGTYYSGSPGNWPQSEAHYMVATDGNWPGSGSKTLYWDGQDYEGITIYIAFFENVDTTAPIIGSDFTNGYTADAWISDSVGTVGADDMGLIVSYGYNATPDVDVNSQTVITEIGAYNSAGFGFAYKLSEDQMQAADSGADNIHVAFGLKAAAGGGDLSVNTSQSINLSESAQGQLSVAGINLFENIRLTESISRRMNLGAISKNETINILESISGFLSVAGISISENITLNENIARSMNLGAININETVGLAESLTSGVPLAFSKFENITLSEFLSLLETIAPSAFDNITITEYLNILKDIGLSEFENITITENITAAITAAGLNVFDSISIEEFISILKDIGVDTSQDITITEVVSAIMLLAGVEISDNITINEALSLLISLAGIDASQSVNITEFVNGVLSVAGVDISESLTITEFINLLITSDLPITDAVENITVSEAIEILFSHLPLTAEQNITIIESVTAALTTTGIDVSDNVNITEYALLILSLGVIDVSESIAVSEAIQALVETTGANVYDTITVNEFILNILDVAGINVNESVTVSEWVYVTMVTVAGLMRVSFGVKKPIISSSVRRPGIAFRYE